MENRSHALAAGLFTVLLVIAAILAVFWLQRDQTDLVPYDLVTYDSVQGLSPQATVRYRGLAVGKVDSIRFDPQRSGAMLVRIGVKPDTPMTDTLKATVAMQGITGLAYIDLDDEGKPGKVLHSSAEHVAQLQMQPSLTERLMTRGKEVLEVLESVATDLQSVMGPDNRQAISTILANSAEASAQLRDTLSSVQPVLKEVGPAVQQLSATVKEAGKAATQLAGLAGEARTLLKDVMSPEGVVVEATKSLAQLQRAVAVFSGMAPQLGDLTEEAEQTVQSVRRTLNTVERAPQSLLFGPPVVRPGPGEPGFSGFGKQ